MHGFEYVLTSSILVNVLYAGEAGVICDIIYYFRRKSFFKILSKNVLLDSWNANWTNPLEVSAQKMKKISHKLLHIYQLISHSGPVVLLVRKVLF